MAFDALGVVVMNRPQTAATLILAIALLIGVTFVTASTVTYDDYKAAVSANNEVSVEGLTMGDGKTLNARLYMPQGDGPFPALVALHGAGGIFPYQLWWAKELSKTGFVVLFVDSYCTRGHLCTHDTDDSDPNRGSIMRTWKVVSIRQRMIDAVGAYMFLATKSYVSKDAVGLIGWSWGGTAALFAQKFAARLNLPDGGFKGTIAFYPNLKYVTDNPRWQRSGKITQPSLILYGEDDALESRESYKELMEEGHPGPISVLGFKGAVRKFDELGDLRIKEHPSVGEFQKAFHEPSFKAAVAGVSEFLLENFK